MSITCAVAQSVIANSIEYLLIVGDLQITPLTVAQFRHHGLHTASEL